MRSQKVKPQTCYKRDVGRGSVVLYDLMADSENVEVSLCVTGTRDKRISCFSNDAMLVPMRCVAKLPPLPSKNVQIKSKK